MSNLHIPPKTWLDELFETEFCSECGGDAEHHTALPVLGNWFARCDFPPDDTKPTAPLHPTVAAFHQAAGRHELVAERGIRLDSQ